MKMTEIIGDPRAHEAAVQPIAATPENIERAQQFLIGKWRERSAERGHEVPNDLTGACKFVSLFAAEIFGGQIRGNWHHQYVVLPDGNRLDLTEPSEQLVQFTRDGIDPYQHDGRFWNNPDHRESMASCEPRVNQWVKEFLSVINNR